MSLSAALRKVPQKNIAERRTLVRRVKLNDVFAVITFRAYAMHRELLARVESRRTKSEEVFRNARTRKNLAPPPCHQGTCSEGTIKGDGRKKGYLKKKKKKTKKKKKNKQKKKKKHLALAGRANLGGRFLSVLGLTLTKIPESSLMGRKTIVEGGWVRFHINRRRHFTDLSSGPS